MGDDVPQSVPTALDEGYRPEVVEEPPEDAEWSEYAWGLVPCPHCDTGMLVGVFDPERSLDGEAPLAIMSPPDSANDSKAEGGES